MALVLFMRNKINKLGCLQNVVLIVLNNLIRKLNTCFERIYTSEKNCSACHKHAKICFVHNKILSICFTHNKTGGGWLYNKLFVYNLRSIKLYNLQWKEKYFFFLFGIKMIFQNLPVLPAQIQTKPIKAC